MTWRSCSDRAGSGQGKTATANSMAEPHQSMVPIEVKVERNLKGRRLLFNAASIQSAS
jgi:hypothetical protein